MAIGNAAEGQAAGAGGNEFGRSWTIVLASLIGMALGLASMPFYTIGIFAPILAREFGWSFGNIMLGVTILSAAMLVFGPIAGRYADRHGARRLTIVSIILFGLGLASFALNPGSLPLYFASWAFMSICGVGTTAITYTRVINLWFVKRRGLALGIALMGSGIFGMLGKPLTNSVIEAYSWRTAYCVLGALPILLSLPLAILFLKEPAERAAVKAEANQPIGSALAEWRFWLIAIAFLVAGSTTGGVAVNLEPILDSHGFPHADVVRLTPLLGLIILIARVAIGASLDRLSVIVVAAALFLANAFFAFALAQDHVGMASAAAAIVGIGLSGGGSYAVMSFLTVRFFGMGNYGAIFAVFTALSIAGPGAGAFVLGSSFDHYHSYAPALIAAGVLALVSTFAIMLLPRRS